MATTAMSNSSASLTMSSLSNARVLPASTASAEAPAFCITRMVPSPTAGTSNRKSCPGLLTFTTTQGPFASLPPLRIVASVPSMASTASTDPRRPPRFARYPTHRFFRYPISQADVGIFIRLGLPLCPASFFSKQLRQQHG